MQYLFVYGLNYHFAKVFTGLVQFNTMRENTKLLSQVTKRLTHKQLRCKQIHVMRASKKQGS